MVFPEVALVRRASRKLVRALGLLQGPDAKVNTTQCHALIELDRAGRLTVQELAALLCLDKSTASRALTSLVRRGLAECRHDPDDKRRKPLSLTREGRQQLERLNGKANRQVQTALTHLAPEDRQHVLAGLELYVKALERAKLHEGLVVRLVTEADNGPLSRIIHEGMKEFGLSGPGTGYDDPELDAISAAYREPRSAFFIAELAGLVLGGGGIRPLKAGAPETCELQRMYFAPEARGIGAGAAVLSHCLAFAHEAGYSTCYLETHHSMHRAQKLYEGFGFERQTARSGNTGHCACNTWFQKKL